MIKEVPVLVKIAPDLEIKELEEIAEVARKMSINGIIVSNTTTERPINSQNHCRTKREDCQEILFSNRLRVFFLSSTILQRSDDFDQWVELGLRKTS